jgi:NADP-dependent aldehyde dehydrogenase
VNPANGAELETVFHPASLEDVDRAAGLAAEAFTEFRNLSAVARGTFLRKIADLLTGHGAEIVERANLETGLPLGRLNGELGRTTGQLRMFAELVEEGSWVDARIDEALPERKPAARPDLRSMLRPLGPVAVFGASNFPLAFSVAGGDTASALAAGCPVIVKAHPAHPGTSELVGRVIQAAVAECGLPAGVFSLLFDAGFEVGAALVRHPAVKAVGFTGSEAGGVALMKLCAARPEPIPCYAEMGSGNPMFVLPGALSERGEALAQGLAGSFTLGSGQFCTKPGIVFVPDSGGDAFEAGLRSASAGQFGMLTPGIAARYRQGVQSRAALLGVPVPDAETGVAATGPAAVFQVGMQEFVAHPELAEEIFGPTTLLVRYGAVAELIAAAKGLAGQLTATIQMGPGDEDAARELAGVLETKVGRVLFNGFPTGVEVSSAMVHGGPFPAASDSRSTSVGTRAILRFARAVCWQDCPDDMLPGELRQENPSKILRIVNGVAGRN